MSHMMVSQQTQNICISFVQRRPNVFDVRSTLYKCYTIVLCLLDCFVFAARYAFQFIALG